MTAGYTAAEREAEREPELAYVKPSPEEWREAGDLRDVDPAVAADLLRAVVLLTLHRGDIGDAYPAVRDLLIQFVADGLVTDTE